METLTALLEYPLVILLLIKIGIVKVLGPYCALGSLRSLFVVLRDLFVRSSKQLGVPGHRVELVRVTVGVVVVAA